MVPTIVPPPSIISPSLVILKPNPFDLFPNFNNIPSMIACIISGSEFDPGSTPLPDKKYKGLLYLVDIDSNNKDWMGKVRIGFWYIYR